MVNRVLVILSFDYFPSSHLLLHYVDGFRKAEGLLEKNGVVLWKMECLYWTVQMDHLFS